MPFDDLRHERVQTALEQMNEISISKIHRDAAKATAKAKRDESFEERIDAILATTKEIAERLQRKQHDDDDTAHDDESDEFSIMDDDAHASALFKRQLSRFLKLPRSLSHREMEEVTHLVLHQVGNTPDHSLLMHEIGTLIDEHVITPREMDDEHDREAKHRPSLAKRRQKELPNLDIHPTSDIEMTQRMLFVSANRLKSTSMRGGFNDESFLRSQKATFSLFPKPSERTLLPKLSSCKSPKMTALAEAELAEQRARQAELEWREAVKQDYIIWLRAKAEAEAQAKKQHHRDASQPSKRKQKPRWLLLYEDARAHQTVLPPNL
ncbi:hypothetical protein SDRG_11087 [Saprolegnia diclina VS20]|uniref:Uncharacterized protein n=1 Tax=Saprolegnia diclina (strain VS20) TaxID=1156394 RepID=T0PZZ7_SAPDV|nr:hypothetical protein SDRG_11087 [Saprolegnia diclina VS20]EQC31159.1 hypothetical protein SDRG_11087 [Saprolegnia diclina VS20]|eukprot:XP_008615332.1 hypothetical protein SDRG_11087 [Saprolegnia diclina VS20]